MIYCPGCGTANREGSRYCNQCGASLSEQGTLACPRCHTPNSIEADHCQACGLDLARVKAGREAGPEPAGASGADEAPEEAGPPGRDASVAAYLRSNGLPPWLDSVEWPEEEPPSWPLPVEREAGSAAERLPRLEQLPGALSIEPIVGVPYKARERREPPVSGEQKAAAALFAEVAAEEVRAAPQDVATGQEGLRPLGAGLRRLVAGVLLVALLVPFLWPGGPFAGAGATPAPVAAAVRAVSDLPPSSTILVAFEYDAGLAGEMEPIAGAILHQLLNGGHRVLAVSTRPEGGALAEMALERAEAEHPSALYGQRVLNLGYAAGGEAAVRALAVDIAATAPFDYRNGRPTGGSAALAGIVGARELPLIVVLGRDLMSVQRWVEQVGAPYATPLLAGVPALAEPAVAPYRAAGQLQGIVAGLNGAAAYERLADSPGQATSALGAVRAGTWAVAGLVVVTNLAGLAGRLRRRQGSGGGNTTC